MKVTAVSWPKVDLWPQYGMVRLMDPVEVALEDRLLFLPKNIYSDGASVPAALWPVLDATPVKLLLPGVLHDAAYRINTHWTMLPGGERVPIKRNEADDLLRAVALHFGVSDLDCAKLRWGVGVGGAQHFHKKRLDWRP